MQAAGSDTNGSAHCKESQATRRGFQPKLKQNAAGLGRNPNGAERIHSCAAARRGAHGALQALQSRHAFDGDTGVCSALLCAMSTYAAGRRRRLLACPLSGAVQGTRRRGGGQLTSPAGLPFRRLAWPYAPPRSAAQNMGQGARALFFAAAAAQASACRVLAQLRAEDGRESSAGREALQAGGAGPTAQRCQTTGPTRPPACRAGRPWDGQRAQR